MGTLALGRGGIESAGKRSAERGLAIRRETAGKAADRAEAAAAEAAQAAGHALPPEALKTIREQVYGIVEDPAA